MFKINDAVTVELDDGVTLRGTVVRITETEHGMFYGVRLKTCEIHGLDAKVLHPAA